MGKANTKDLKAYLEFEAKLHRYVKGKMCVGKLPTVRQAARRFRVRQQDVLGAAESMGLNVNVGIHTQAGIGEFESVGDYELEDLDFYSCQNGDLVR